METGNRGEEIAARHLKKCGYRIVERNYRCVFGEIDIIARDGQVLVFVEVRSRRTDRHGSPLESIGLKKQRKLSLLAVCYMKERRLSDISARFDVVAVNVREHGDEIKLIKNAFVQVSGSDD